VAALPQVRELNIGHFLIGEAILEGMPAVITRMRAVMNAARAQPPTRP
jgi:pyridoxine 5-phosphate synthase